MKKLLKDGREPEEVHDILGLRIILNPKAGDGMVERGQRACYRTCEVIQSLQREIPVRTKDYIAWPKANGYESLHMAVDVSDSGRSIPLMEIQIRTTEMDKLAVGGSASHALYKGGLTDPEEVKGMPHYYGPLLKLPALLVMLIESNKYIYFIRQWIQPYIWKRTAKGVLK